MEDLFWDIFLIALIVLCYLCLAFVIFLLTPRIIDICNTNKPKKKHYLIKYELYCKHEIIIKAKSPLEARLKFQKKYKKYNLVSVAEMKDE